MGHSFTDQNGRTWPITIGVADVRRVRQSLGFDLLGNRQSLERLLTDPVTLVDVLAALLEPAARERGVPSAEFQSAIVGDVIDDAADALFAALCDFLPSRIADPLCRLHRGHRALQAEAAQEVLAALDSPEFDRLCAEEIERLTLELNVG